MDMFAPDLWILVTLAAAVFQTVRFMLQKFLATATLSAAGATFSRFLYSWPVYHRVISGLFRGDGQRMATDWECVLVLWVTRRQHSNTSDGLRGFAV